MTTSPGKSIRIAADQARPTLSKDQKTFNTRIRQIDVKRGRLAAWEAAIPAYEQRHAREVPPLLKASMDVLLALVRRLDYAHGQKGLTKSERNMVGELIGDWTGDLLAYREIEDVVRCEAEALEVTLDQITVALDPSQGVVATIASAGDIARLKGRLDGYAFKTIILA